MIATRTPLRVSFVGGGTDLRWFCREHGGAVVSTAIDQYVDVFVRPVLPASAASRPDSAVAGERLPGRAVSREDKRVRATLAHFAALGDVDIASYSGAPGAAGLGSSSSFTVGLLHALHRLRGRSVGPRQLAHEACEVEIDDCQEPIGGQDQYAAAFGGLNFIEFATDDAVRVTPLRCREETLDSLQQHLLVFFTGTSRSASAVLHEQRDRAQSDRVRHERLRRMMGLAFELRAELEADRLTNVGQILHENWLLKRSLAEAVSNDEIDAWYETARREGATGGKILGAGGGGCMLFFASPERHEAIERALPRLTRLPIRLEARGSRVLHDAEAGADTAVA